jgi:hypothetical protein
MIGTNYEGLSYAVFATLKRPYLEIQISPSAPCFQIPRICIFLIARHQVSHPYKTAGAVMLTDWAQARKEVGS